jgi:hypothetical protein
LQRAVIITIDGWGTNLVGAYGNALCETPHLDAIAAHAAVFDRCWTSSLAVEETLRSIATGCHPLQANPPNLLLGDELRHAGLATLFMTDDPVVANGRWLESMDEALLIDPDEEAITSLMGPESSEALPEAAWTETRLARFLQAALGEWTRRRDRREGRPALTWLHLSGLSSRWDAPYDYRLRLCDLEEDPEPPREMRPAAFQVTAATDPDQIFGTACSVAAQGILIDQLFSWLDPLLHAEDSRGQCLWIILGTRGFPLGEHQSVGYPQPQPYAEQVHVPLLIQPGLLPLGLRIPELVQPTMLRDVIRKWLIAPPSSPVSDSATPPTPRLAPSFPWEGQAAFPPAACLVAGDDHRALQVERWNMVETTAGCGTIDPPSAALSQLYLAPDDRWQQNDIASRCLELHQEMRGLADAWESWLKNGADPQHQPPLPESLTRRIV